MPGGVQLTLVATKLRPPTSPAGLVRRPRLDEVLDRAGPGIRLVLVSAPAGSGKSTLLSSWAAARADGVAWLQVEQSDSDPARFWSYLVESIAVADAGISARLQPTVAGTNGDDGAVVPGLVNELSGIVVPLTVVIDDYHLIDHPTVHRGIERLVELAPDHVTFAIATRIDPPFRLARLRARGQLAEIRAADLRFDADEAPQLLGPGAEALTVAQVDQLCDRTEGWAAGLVLAGVSLSRASDPGGFVKAFRGDDHHVADYLSDELLDRLAPDDRRRLLETSILDELEGSLVDAVTNRSGGAAWLTATANSVQLLIGLDSTGTWYRYHHMLRDVLRVEAERALPDLVPTLHERAADWFAARSDHERAIAHHLAAGDAPAAARLVRFHGPWLLRRGQIGSIRMLLDRLGEVARTDTACCLLAGWCDYTTGRHAAAQAWIDLSLTVAPPGFDRTLTTPLQINVLLAEGDVATAFGVAQDMIDADQLRTHAADLPTAVGAAHVWAGRTDEARDALGVALEMAIHEDSRTAHVLALVYLAILELDVGSPAAAGAAAVLALDTAERFGLSSYHGIAPAYAIRGRTDDDPIGGRADALHAVELARRASTRLAFGHVLTVAADTLLASQAPQGERLLAEAATVLGRCPDPGIAGRHLARVMSRHGSTSDRRLAMTGEIGQLTDREIAVLRYLPTSLSQREIGDELYVSLNTVKTHCSAIYRKLAVGDRKAAVQAARDRRLLDG